VFDDPALHENPGAMRSSFERELAAAKKAVARARSLVERVDRSALDTRRKRRVVSIISRLERAEDASHASWPSEHSIRTVYEAVRWGLGALAAARGRPR
jgi:hypothetical protein